MKNISVYLHIPFCQRKCFYCAFNSFPWQEGLAEEFLQGLKNEIKDWGKELSPFLFQVPTLFLGGGTPTCLSSRQLEEILELCQQYLPLSPEAEISVEANPGTVDKEKLLVLQQGGVNRLSFGVQSLNNEFLRFLGRIHTKEEFLANYYLARDLGFNNINLDFIFALPNQSLAQWQATLQEVVDLNPEHLSTYNLLLEEGTPLTQSFQRGEFSQAEEDLDLAMYEETISFLTAQGFNHYEISNFAKPGRECRHNLVYWRNQEYLGLGPGAHSFFSGTRFFNCLSVEEYVEKLKLKQSPVVEKETIPLQLEMGETMMQGLRLREGISLADFQQRFGLSLEEVYSEQLAKLKNLRLIVLEDGRISLTRQGLYLANNVFQEFLL